MLGIEYSSTKTGIFDTTNSTGGTQAAGTANGSAGGELTIGSGGLTIDSGAGAVTIGSTYTPYNSIASNGIVTAMNSYLPINLAATQTWSNNSSNLLTVNLAAQALSTGTTLNINSTGSGGITFNGALSDGTGQLALVVASTAGTTTLAAPSTSFTGGVTVNSGTLTWSQNYGIYPEGPLVVTTTGSANSILNIMTSTTFAGLSTPGGTLGGSGTATININSTTASPYTDSTLTINQTTAGTYAGIIAGTGASQSVSGFALGSGSTSTLSLTGLNTYAGLTTLSGGTLNLNLTTNSNVLKSGNAVTLGGGTLQISGGSNGNSQNLGTPTFSAGTDNITLTPGSTTATNLLTTSNTWNRNVGAVTNITVTPGATGNLAASPTLLNGVIVGSNNSTAFATVNGTGWASVTSGQVVPLPSYTSSSYTSGTANVSVGAADSPSSFAANTLSFRTGQASTLTLPAGTANLTAGGVLVSSAVGTNSSTITGGTLSSATNELVLQQFNTGGTLTISSVIGNNNGGVAPLTLTTGGPGTTILAATNTYSGPTYVDAGTLQIGNGTLAGTLGLTTAPNSLLGNFSTAVNVANGATLAFDNPSTLTVPNIIAGAVPSIRSAATPPSRPPTRSPARPPSRAAH